MKENTIWIPGMSDLSKKPPASNAPVYCAAMYPGLAEIARKHGYALAVHGSLTNDFDLIAVPWVPRPHSPKTVVREIMKKYDVKLVLKPHIKNKNRLCYLLSIGFGNCQLDLQFFGNSNDTHLDS